MLRKTDYSGNTTLITSSFGQSGEPAVTHIGDYYYVLDSTESIIRKYDKTNDTVVQNITVHGGVREIIGTKGTVCGLLLSNTGCLKKVSVFDLI